MVTANKRRDKDVMKLLVSEYDVNLVNENSNAEFIVKFFGPQESPYEGVSFYNIFANEFNLLIYRRNSQILLPHGKTRMLNVL